jgi:hypothetical protein
MYEPGTHSGALVSPEAAVTYGVSAPAQLVWTAEAQRLLEVIPVFVRGRVQITVVNPRA